MFKIEKLEPPGSSAAAVSAPGVPEAAGASNPYGGRHPGHSGGRVHGDGSCQGWRLHQKASGGR